MSPFLSPFGTWPFPGSAPPPAAAAPGGRADRRRRPSPSPADCLTFFRPGTVWPGRYWEEQGAGGGDPPPAARAPEEPPLTPTERLLYGAFAVMCALALLTFLSLVALAHSPLIAN